MAQGGVYRTGRDAQNIRFRDGCDRIRRGHSRRDRLCKPDLAARECEVPYPAKITALIKTAKSVLYREPVPVLSRAASGCNPAGDPSAAASASSRPDPPPPRAERP